MQALWTGELWRGGAEGKAAFSKVHAALNSTLHHNQHSNKTASFWCFMCVPKDAKASRVIRWQPRGTNIYLRSLDKEQGGERSLTQVKIRSSFCLQRFPPGLLMAPPQVTGLRPMRHFLWRWSKRLYPLPSYLALSFCCLSPPYFLAYLFIICPSAFTYEPHEQLVPLFTSVSLTLRTVQ